MDDESPTSRCPNCHATVRSEWYVTFEAGGTRRTLVECQSCAEVFPGDTSTTTDADADSIAVSTGRRVQAACANCGVPTSVVIPTRTTLTDARPDGVVETTCGACDTSTAVGFERTEG